MGSRLIRLALGAGLLVACQYSGPLDLSTTNVVAGVTNIEAIASVDPAYGTVLNIRGARYTNGTGCPLYGGGFGIKRGDVTGPTGFLYGDLVAGNAGVLYFRTPVAAPFTYYVVGTYQGPASGPPSPGQPFSYALSTGLQLTGSAGGGSFGGSLGANNAPCFLYINANTLPSPVSSPALAL